MSELIIREYSEVKTLNSFKIVIPTFNAEMFIDLTIKSILKQSYKHFRCYIINDGSVDKTLQIAKKAAGDDPRFEFISHELKHNPLYSLRKELPNICDKDNDIVVLIDGDDWLYHDGVLELLNNIYQNTEMMLTYGQYITSRDYSIGCSRKLENIDDARNPGVNFSHLRTFKYILWRYIREQDLKDNRNEYYAMAGDTAYMLPMIEMAGIDRLVYIDRILYCYNTENANSEVNLNATQQEVNDAEIRKKERYMELRTASELKTEEVNVIKEYIKNGDVVFDVGANIGNWIKVVLENYDRIHGYCFEPIKEICDYLEWVVKDNEVTCVDIGLGAIDGEKDFWYYTKVSELSTFFRRNTKVEEGIINDVPELKKIHVMSLDNYCAVSNVPTINFLKVDVEGAELEVFKGAEKMISEGRINYILFEYGGCNIDAKVTLKAIMAWFEKRPYTFYKVKKDGLEEIDKFRDELEDYGWCNFLLKKKEIVKFTENIRL